MDRRKPTKPYTTKKGGSIAKKPKRKRLCFREHLKKLTEKAEDKMARIIKLMLKIGGRPRVTTESAAQNSNQSCGGL